MEEIKKILLNEVNELYKDRHIKYKNKYSYEILHWYDVIFIERC